MPSRPTKLLAVRVPEAERRRIKSLAAIRGLSLQDAVQQALELWASQFQVDDVPTAQRRPSPLASEHLEKPRRQKPRR